MKRAVRHNANQRTTVAQDALNKYLAALEEIYPAAKGQTGISVRQDGIIVTVPLPTRARERMRLFDRMAEVGTKLLLETDQYIILSGQ
jgi:hypothetical protein